MTRSSGNRPTLATPDPFYFVFCTRESRPEFYDGSSASAPTPVFVPVW
jgi:hypothetical protein